MEPISHVRKMLADLVGGPDTPFMARRAQAKAFADAFVVPGDIRIEQDKLGGIACERIRCTRRAPEGVLFHLHGGGYVLGDPAGSRPFTCEFAKASGMEVVSVDYRLAPEVPFPAAVDDALSAYRALLDRGMAARSIVIGGESAGGGLAVATLLAARNAGLPLPSCAILISPWTDLTCSSDSFDTKADCDPLLTRRSLKEMADAYLGAKDAKMPLASPNFADLRQLPPMLIHVGSDEVLLDDSRILHARAIAAGVDAQIEVWDRMIHVWHMFSAMLPQGHQAIARLASFAGAHVQKDHKAAAR